MTGVQTCALPICFPVTIGMNRTYFVQQKPNYPLIRAVFQTTDKATPAEEKLVLPTYTPVASPNKTRSDAKKQAKAAKRESKRESNGWESPNIIDLAEPTKAAQPLPEKAEFNAIDATGESVLDLPPFTGKPVIVLSAAEPMKAKSELADYANEKRKDLVRLYPGLS